MPEPTPPALAPLVALLNEPGVQHLQPPNWRSRVDAAITEASALLGETAFVSTKATNAAPRPTTPGDMPPSDAQEGAQALPGGEVDSGSTEVARGAQIEGERT